MAMNCHLLSLKIKIDVHILSKVGQKQANSNFIALYFFTIKVLNIFMKLRYKVCWTTWAPRQPDIILGVSVR